MEQLFSFENEDFCDFLQKWISSIWHYYMAAKSKNLLRRNKFSGKSIWSSYICSILTQFYNKFLLFRKSIWVEHSKSILVSLGNFSGNVADFAKTLLNVRSGGAFLGMKNLLFVIFRDLGSKNLPQTLCFIRFAQKWRPWAPRARKASIWTTNSKSKLIFWKTHFFQKIASK